MKDIFAVVVIAFGTVGASSLLGFSEQAGLFGAILGVGIYTCEVRKGDSK